VITEQDLQEAIAECEGQRNPNANTCIKLAAFYTIRDHMFGGGDNQDSGAYSFASAAPDLHAGAPEPKIIDSGTEFSDLANTMDMAELLEIMDELMTTIQVTNPRLYAGVIRRMTE